MAGPYDYTVNIPQPPAQNFLQSLMGIQQLKQMQEQSAIQQQQAGIQAQQAQFAQELQPIEKQRLEASLAAQRAGTSATQTNQQAAQYQLDQRKALDTELAGISSDPTKFTADNIQRVALKFHNVDPTLLVRAGEMRKNLSEQGKIFGDNLAKNLVITSVTGDSVAAIKQLDKQLEAAKNTPALQDFVPKIEQLKENFINYPDQTVALAAVGQTLFASDQGKAITDVLAEQAKIGKTKAETTGEKTKSELQEAQARLARADAALKEIDAEGGPKSDRIIKQENLMRSAFSVDPVVRGYESANRNFQTIKTADNSTAGDRARIVAFIKLQQPDSVVSVTESGQIEAPTAPQQIQALIEKFQDKGLLGDTARKQLESQAKSIYNASEFSFKKLKANTEKMASGYGIDPKNVTGLFEQTESSVPPLNPPLSPTGAPGRPVSTGNIPVAPSGANPLEAEMRRRGLIQ
jgi:hypothetical protein